MQNADLDGLGGLKGPGHTHGGNRGRKGESFDQAATLHGAISRYLIFLVSIRIPEGICKGCAVMGKRLCNRALREKKACSRTKWGL